MCSNTRQVQDRPDWEFCHFVLESDGTPVFSSRDDHTQRGKDEMEKLVRTRGGYYCPMPRRNPA